MKYKGQYKRLNLPAYMKFGIEIEANNVQTKNGLYAGESAKFITDRNWHMATKWEESLVGANGAELVSPILTDTENTWRNIAEICSKIKEFPKDKSKEVKADEKCGLHVHFDAEYLASDPKKMKNFLHIYSEAEELIYKMCNDKNDPIRPKAINKNFHGLSNVISAIWRNGMAAPTGKKILKKINNGTLKVSHKKFGKLRMVASKFKLDERRYAGLNLTNIGNSKKNTIEFRMANGTLNPEVIKQNVFLYASIIDTAVKVTEEPEKYEKKIQQFLNHDVTEQEKAQSFLNLIMDSDEDKKIYLDRWESVKDSKVFKKNYRKGFSQNRFTREQFKNIAMRAIEYDILADSIGCDYLPCKERCEFFIDTDYYKYDNIIGTISNTRVDKSEIMRYVDKTTQDKLKEFNGSVGKESIEIKVPLLSHYVIGNKPIDKTYFEYAKQLKKDFRIKSFSTYFENVEKEWEYGNFRPYMQLCNDINDIVNDISKMDRELICSMSVLFKVIPKIEFDIYDIRKLKSLL